MRMIRNATGIMLLTLLALFVGGCSIFASKKELPPILSQDELVHPYEKLGRIQITRDVYVVDATTVSDMRAWGYQALREEAAKMNADALILPEVSGHTTTPVMLPSVLPATEYRAIGVAIKFK